VLTCLALLGAGCGSSASPATTEEGALQQAPAQPSSAGGIATGAERRALAARYLAIARAGNRGLDHSLDPLGGRDKNRLAPARADLRYATNVEHTFDRRLLKIPFPPRTEKVAMTLYRVNQARASLTATAAARSTSVGALHAYEARLGEANKRVEAAVRTIRRQLDLPPPPGS
jgi:hypothetical protein